MAQKNINGDVSVSGIVEASQVLRGALEYSTTEPSAANTNGLKIVVLNQEPATKYAGWLYIITEA